MATTTATLSDEQIQKDVANDIEVRLPISAAASALV